MATYSFERESRTPYSEAYSIERDGDEMGRVDIHFTQSGAVYATLCVPAAFAEDDVEDLIAEIDERLVLAAEAFREDFIVTVWRGERVGVYSEDDDEGDEDTNGASPREF